MAAPVIQARVVHPTYALVLAEARSCLAALTDVATSADRSAAYERLLIDLDVLKGDVGPAAYSIVDVSVDELVERAKRALGCLTAYGVDALEVALLVARLHRRRNARCSADGGGESPPPRAPAH